MIKTFFTFFRVDVTGFITSQAQSLRINLIRELSCTSQRWRAQMRRDADPLLFITSSCAIPAIIGPHVINELSVLVGAAGLKLRQWLAIGGLRYGEGSHWIATLLIGGLDQLLRHGAESVRASLPFKLASRLPTRLPKTCTVPLLHASFLLILHVVTTRGGRPFHS